MSDAAAISATFSDWRTVKGRKCLQLIFEVPLEQQGRVLDYLGAPMPDEHKWVAIALLKETGSVGSPPERTKAIGAQAPALPSRGQGETAPKTHGQQAVDRAWQMCKDYRFLMFSSAHPLRKEGQSAAEFIRERCAVKSRAEFATDKRALQRFLGFEADYLAATGQTTEQRG